MYDDLIPDYFGVPANPGAPTILEIALEWITFSPDGSVHDFSSETGVPVGIVEKYWKRLQLLAVLEEEHRTIKDVAKEWLRYHPDGLRTEFSIDLGVEYVLRKHLPQSEDPFPSPEEVKQREYDVIGQWFEKNPDGTKKECAKSTGISIHVVDSFCEEKGMYSNKVVLEGKRPQIEQWVKDHPDETKRETAERFGVTTAYIKRIRTKLRLEATGETKAPMACELARKYALWMIQTKNEDTDECASYFGVDKAELETLKPKINLEIERMRQVSEWIACHPNGNKNECLKTSGIAQDTIFCAWEQLGGMDFGQYRKDGSQRILEQVREWVDTHKPYGTIAECARNLGYSTTTIGVYWEQAGGGKRQEKDIRSEERIYATAKWLVEHPTASPIECANAVKDVGLGAKTIRSMTSFIKRIARWRTDNPNGTPEDCAKDLGKPLRKIINYWPAVTLWMENGGKC